jgi:hypothetical protein
MVDPVLGMDDRHRDAEAREDLRELDAPVGPPPMTKKALGQSSS